MKKSKRTCMIKAIYDKDLERERTNYGNSEVVEKMVVTQKKKKTMCLLKIKRIFKL